MSTVSVGDVIVQYKADISDLTSKISQAKSDMSSVGNSAQSSGNSIFGGFGKAISGALSFGAQIGQTVIGIKGLADGAIGLGDALLGPAMQMEQMTTAFTTLDGSASAATDELMRLNTFAAKTPFQTADIDHAAASLQAFGIKATDVIPDLTGIGDALSSMGKTSGADLDQITLAFGHIQTEGHLSGRTLMELGQLGINGMAMLEKATGKSKDELQKMISGGTLPAKEAIADLVTGIEKSNLGGGMAKQAQTAAGQLSTLKSNANLALAALAGPALKLAEGGLSQLGNLLSSPSFQQFAVSTGKDIATAFTDIGNVIGPVASGIGSIINWFIQGSAPSQVVGTALLMIAGGFAAIQIGAFVAAVPALVAGFIAWGAAAWVAAIGTIAATWPLFAIGAAVVLVVAIIILAVRNWGAISAWLVGAWKSAIGWLGGAMNSIGGFFTSVWNGIKSGLTAAWNWIINALKAAGMLLLAIILGPFIAIAALFIWLYNHNTYFKMLVDAIVNFFKGCFKWLQDAWNNIVNWLVGLWDRIQTDVKAGWEKISNIFKGIWQNYIAGPLGGLFNSIVGWIGGMANEVFEGWKIIWQKVSDIFSTIWNTYIAKPLNSVWTSITGWFSNLGKSAMDAGKNFINMLVNGIKSGAGAIWDAVKNIASNIWKALGFHSPPPDGPAKDSDKWMPNFIKMLSSGLTAGAPQVKTASQYVAAQMVYPIKPSASSIAVVAGNSSSAGSGGQGQTFILEVDSVQLAKITNRATDRIVRLKLASNGRAA